MSRKTDKPRTNYRPTIQSLGRGLTLLDHVISAGKPVSLGELAALLEIQRSSTHRLMATLVAYGYIHQDTGKRYIPGPAIMELASKVGSREQVHEIAGPYLNALAEKTGETTHMAVLGRDGAILTNCVTSNHTLAVTSRVGQAEPLYCTALGKALVCETAEKEIKLLLGKGRLKKYTPKTITTTAGFIAECHAVSSDRLAKDDEEFRGGIRCLAAPVKDFRGNVVAAIGISGPTSRLTNTQYEAMGNLVREIGIALSKKLGYVFEG